jgi:hypothetical protein
MALTKKRQMTERSLAAHRRNAAQSRGPATAAGRERIRAANLRHGFYSQADEAALRTLGENPAEFRQLLEGLRAASTAATTLEEHLANRLARAVWRVNRVDRMQEGLALQLAQDANWWRDNRLHTQMMKLKMTLETLRGLAQSVAREHYVTTPADFKKIRSLQEEGALKEIGEIALPLFRQLRPPGAPPDEEFRDGFRGGAAPGALPHQGYFRP